MVKSEIVRYIGRSSGELLRDYLQRRLYSNHGFFSQLPLLEGERHDFGKFKSKWEYEETVRGMIKQRKGKFVTPSELFRPWYGVAIANWALAEHSTMGPGVPLQIFEVGAGNASTAEDCLQYLRDHHPLIYKDCTYNVIEVTHALAEQQRQRLAGFIRERKANVFNRSIIDWDVTINEPCCVIGLEVLDNMPHDRILITRDRIFQTHVIEDELTKFTQFELFPLEDDLIMKTAHYWRRKPGYRDPASPLALANVAKRIIEAFRYLMPLGAGEVFVPTVAVKFLETLREKFPKHSMLLSDFNFVIRGLPGDNGPLVQSYGPERIHSCISAASVHSCDVIFPTDFSRLSYAYEELCKKRSHVQTHEQFLSKFMDVRETELPDRSNPLLEMYPNIRYATSNFKDVIVDPELIQHTGERPEELAAN